jgi:hypothetical protein
VTNENNIDRDLNMSVLAENVLAELELNQDELLCQINLHELYKKITLWLDVIGLQCQLIRVDMDDFVDDGEDEVDLPLIRSKSILRVLLSTDDHVDFLPLVPYVMGDNQVDYFAQVDFEIGERKYILVMKDKNGSWDIAEYMGYGKPKQFSSLSQVNLSRLFIKQPALLKQLVDFKGKLREVFVPETDDFDIDEHSNMCIGCCNDIITQLCVLHDQLGAIIASNSIDAKAIKTLNRLKWIINDFSEIKLNLSENIYRRPTEIVSNIISYTNFDWWYVDRLINN